MKRWGLILLLLAILVGLLVLGIWLGQKIGVRYLFPGNRNEISQVDRNAPIKITNPALLDELLRVAAQGEDNAPQRIEWQIERGLVPLDDSVAAYLPDSANRGARLMACSQPIMSGDGQRVTIKIIVSENAKDAVSRGDITKEKVTNLVLFCIIRAVSDNRQAEYVKAKLQALQPLLKANNEQFIVLNL